MSRKNLLASITGSKPTAPEGTPPLAARPSTPGLSSRGALGAVTRTIDTLAARASTAKELEARLANGATVVDLTPALVDRSFVDDRMPGSEESYAELLEAIRQTGQESPILVRPHPQQTGRFQAAFGHRRLRAAAELGRPVRAIVRQLSDLELVLAQGQENSARADLSFIERARFAKRLEDLGYTRDTIMTALGIDKTTLSRLISVATEIPSAMIEAVGAAPGVGRDRWMELVGLLRNAGVSPGAEALVRTTDFTALPSDDRFGALHRAFSDPAPSSVSLPHPADTARPPRARSTYWATEDGKRLVKITASDRAFVLTIDAKAAPAFGEFLLAEMEQLYDTYRTRFKR
ncbi:plasmid partitioning protein RepB [Acidisphaera sp. L21]|uniref:plasmid partitioning protein RepB n=1 Tax=Acidisphaera sp. L21 TaxID=1641851 RepID=UPI00131A8E1D|nr:plasmid partitioning protein RepB [Acidisphaera sp. L21]